MPIAPLDEVFFDLDGETIHVKWHGPRLGDHMVQDGHWVVRAENTGPLLLRLRRETNVVELGIKALAMVKAFRGTAPGPVRPPEQRGLDV